mmetsp:Transcript_10800/g.26417  ORF Transcript_10800/g.26417 Transcript_10800/m.26417 type:complete len:248 (-) Transcript_10800:309-1052(-)|eukprot:CAMPEP_0114518936 /NCGR_PEP_ID=MMETSP0109-20121206/18716_1 /TAXON_ID=29199 /ORGANISM="Chlorarachnion reptans, Strain CCCM449" /LENGTH=247 /DNA_ID=CAMNT_0001699603 /DNA_START=69 /DNA_END=815 /DNA_ORIENTATION=-
MDKKGMIKYVGVARLDAGSDHTIVASYCTDEYVNEYEKYIDKILRQDSKLKEGKLLRIPASKESYDFLVKLPRPEGDYDMRLAIVGVVDRLMSKSKCAALCKQVTQDFKDNHKPRQIILAEESSLNGSSRKLLMAAIQKHGNDKMAELNDQLGAVKAQMKTNLLAAVERGDNLDDIEVGTRDLMDGAQRFNKTSAALKRMMCCKNVKMTICLTLLILTILTIIIVIAVCTQGDTCSQKKNDNNNNNN